MAATRLGLYELLAPQFLAGFTFPDHIDRYLSVLGVDELRMASDESGVVYTGVVSFTGAAGASPDRVHRDPSGAVFEWEDVTISFRLTIPRDGAAPINDAVTAIASTLPDLNDLFTTYGAIEQTATAATEYPGIRFRLELMVSALTFHLGSSWVPGEVGDNFRIVRSTDPAFANRDVKFVLPKIVLEYEQGDDLSVAPLFRLKSWGSSGFDAAHDLAQGELVRMEPPIALHESGRWAFGVDQVLIDLSEDHTPPEILQFFGTDEAFKGLYIKSARLYYANTGTDFGLNIGLNDLLISFAGEVSLEASVDLLMSLPLSGFNVDVRFYVGSQRIDYTRGTETSSGGATTVTGGRATVSQTAVAQLDIRGGFPEYTISATIDGTEVWDGTRRDARISPDMPATLQTVGEHTLVVDVTDSAPTPHHFTHTITLTVVAAETEVPAADRDGSELDRAPEEGDRQAATLTIDPTDLPLPQGYEVRLNSGSSSETETLAIDGGSNPRVVVREGTTTLLDRTLGAADRQVTVTCRHGATLQVQVDYPAVTGSSETFRLFFDRDKPDHDDWPAVKATYLNNSPVDTRFNASVAPSGNQTLHGADALRDWVQNRVVPASPGDPKTLTVVASASFENETLEDHDLVLSQHRREIAIDIIGSHANVTGGDAAGHASAVHTTDETTRSQDRVARIEGITGAASPAKTVHATLTRPARPAPPAPTPVPVVRDSPRPPDVPQRRPAVLRRLSFRIRLERNIPVLVEFSGEIDFETEMEQRLRTESATPAADGNLALQQRGGASANTANPADGIVDFKINVTYDTATKQLTETLSLGAAPGDIDGLLRMENPRTAGSPPTAANRFKNIFGALLVFAPIINSAASSLEPGSAGSWVAMGVSLVVPVGIGGLDVFRTTSVTLYGGEMKFRQFLPSGTDPLRFTDAGVLFDYGVEFGIKIDQLGIETTRPLKVRYKAVGFNLHFEDGVTYQPIFDTSKGYEIDLSDPGLFNLPGALGSLLRILSARIARFNPLTLELDVGLKVDLGVIAVNRFKITQPLEPFGPPMILPTGAKVNIPATLVGEGYVNIIDRVVDGVAQKGIEGSLDVTLIPMKTRVAASLGVVALEDLATQRKVIAVFAGLIVEFPTPILLWSTGLGLYGFSGLFAMHYRRTELPRPPGDSVSPALRWLEKAEGEPAKLNRSDGETLWTLELDRWSFGIGIILGTVDTGFLLNVRGMFVLELPGPRILIFVKVQIISVLPELGDAGLTVGILGVIDLDFNLGQLTIGVLLDVGVENLVELRVPVEIFFKFQDTRQWHVYLGTIQAPASAKVLNLVRARGYFMIDGSAITPFPPAIAGNPAGPGLPGIAVATGIDASVLFGSEDVGLYLRVSAGAHLGVSFTKFFITGIIYLEGELRLFIVSIGAHGTLTVEAPSPTVIRGEVCGEVDFFFFSVGGCVSVTIGSGTHVLPAPPLVRGVFLQSHAPVISAGQGGDRPIDASLGNAIELTASGNLPPGVTANDVPSVPIDTVLVLQLQCSPRITDGSSAVTTFTQPLVTPPGLLPGGWVNAGGGRRVRYLLREIRLDRPFFVPTPAMDPPATWRREVPPGPQGANTYTDLALFSNVPTTGERALERSTDLNNLVTTRWENMCQPVAPPACVLWTFCRQPLGPSGHGWILNGIAQPDPPGTIRVAPPPTTLEVEEPILSPGDQMLELALADAFGSFNIPAHVIGADRSEQEGDFERVCIDFGQLLRGSLENVLKNHKLVVRVLDHTGAQHLVTLNAKGQFTGLECGITLEIDLPHSASMVLAELVSFSQPASLEVEDEEGKVYFAKMTVGSGKAETLTVSGRRLQRVVIRAPLNETLLLQFCYLREPGKDQRNLDCFRALQLPRVQSRQPNSSIELTEKLKDYAANRPNNQWIILETGAAIEVTMFMAISPELIRHFLILELDRDDNVIDQHALLDLSPQPVTGVQTGLPAAWLSAPWQVEVSPVATFLSQPEFGAMQRLIFSVKPKEKCVKLKLLVDSKGNVDAAGIKISKAILAVVQVCSTAEVERAAEGEQIRTGEISTVTDYLDGTSLVPLLRKNTVYNLTVTYDGEAEQADGSTDVTPFTQRFRFRTDAHEPARLDPWVLGTTPTDDEQYHFYNDPVKVIFNDLSVVQLFQAYGKNLRAVLRAADGLPDARRMN